MEERDWGDNKISTIVRAKDYLKLYRHLNTTFTLFTIKLMSIFSPTLGAKKSWKLFTSPIKIRRRPRDMFRLPEIKQRFYYMDGKEIKNVYTYFFGVKSNPTILFVHGWSKQGLDFYKFVPHLLNAGYSVMAFDGPAHGASSGNQTNAIEFIDIINRLGHKCGYFEAIIAHSFGGLAASVALEQNPTMAKKLITIGAPNQLESIINFFTSNLGISNNVSKKLTKHIEDFYKIKIDQISTAKSINISKVPTLIVHDKDDRQVPFRKAKEIAKNCPSAKLLETHTLGHNKILFDLDTISQIIDFIK